MCNRKWRKWSQYSRLRKGALSCNELLFLEQTNNDMSAYWRTQKNFPQVNETYTKTMNATQSLLLNFKQDPQNLVRVFGNINDFIAFGNNKWKRKKNNDKSHSTCQWYQKVTMRMKWKYVRGKRQEWQHNYYQDTRKRTRRRWRIKSRILWIQCWWDKPQIRKR